MNRPDPRVREDVARMRALTLILLVALTPAFLFTLIMLRVMFP